MLGRRSKKGKTGTKMSLTHNSTISVCVGAGRASGARWSHKDWDQRHEPPVCVSAARERRRERLLTVMKKAVFLKLMMWLL